MKKVFIIAEAGVNHNGVLGQAYQLIDAAKDAGADAVKFQTFKAENIVSAHAEKADYQKKKTATSESQLEMIQKLELRPGDHENLIQYCLKKEILFLSSPFDPESIDFLNALGLNIFKIPSGEITNLPYLRKIGRFNKKIILSTGMSCLGEIESAMNILTDSGTDRDKITLLHCNTEYPTPFEDVNLNAMRTMGNAFKLPVGYSDHTPGIEAPIAAVAMGASVIEKHFTLDKNMEGPDHEASLEPDELKTMIAAIRNIEIALGNGIKTPSKSELKNIDIVRKSIVANREIKKGEHFTEGNIVVKRPGGGISPMRWDEIVGSKARISYDKDELLCQ
ncbi:N,N'-diacetyllegionaminic acid synthase [Candidatus Desulfarcum epimagneticum]|uniref:N,N'-diacetyllegionaminic acid synthase n=1 Tax=uncultured Desulfobacteraceae bacterium TaxID=218296 RepID=A0A484HGY3_9BACT|nr:N,N'-diacetyllegionaminic acid synthase [uncultured Desulfobacteraceae bacterium]